jgi:hypothetical protein
MRIHPSGLGRLISSAERSEHVLVLPLSFLLKEGESHKIYEANVPAVDFGDGAAVRPVGSPTFHPPGSPGADDPPPIRYPVHLRSDTADGVNRLDLHVPLVLDRPPSPDGGPIEGTMELELTFRGIVRIGFHLDVAWDPKAGSLRLRGVRRRDSVRPLLTSLLLLAGILIGISVWNELLNKGVHAQREYVSPETVDKVIFFLVGFFGIHALTLAWRTLGDWMSLAFLPELYLSPETSFFLRSHRVATGLCLSLAPLGFLIFWFWSVECPAGRRDNPNLLWFDAKGSPLLSDRLYRRDLDGLTLRCDKFENPVLARIGETGEIEPETYQVTLLDHSWEAVDAGCQELQTKDEHDRLYSFSVDRSLDDPCLRPYREEIVSLLCGGSGRGEAFLARWDSSGGRAVTISNPTELAAGSLEGLAEDHWWPRLEGRRGDVVVRDVDPQILVESLTSRNIVRPTHVVVQKQGFLDLYERYLDAFEENGVDASVQAMTVATALLDLYIRSSPPLEDADLRRFSQDLTSLLPHRTNRDLDLQDKAKVRSYLRFLLIAERTYCDRPGARVLADALETVFEKEGYEYYRLYLDEWIWVAERYTPAETNQGCDSTRSRLEFLRNSLVSVKDDAVGLRDYLLRLAAELSDRSDYFAPELAMIHSLLGEVAKNRLAAAPEGEGTEASPAG